MRVPKERLLDMLDAIERIEKYVSKGRAAFEQDELTPWKIIAKVNASRFYPGDQILFKRGGGFENKDSTPFFNDEVANL